MFILIQYIRIIFFILNLLSHIKKKLKLSQSISIIFQKKLKI